MDHAWRVLPYHVGSTDLHFALSDALVRHTTEPTLWWHATTRPTLIIGAGQVWDRLNAEACHRENVSIVQRQAGGTAVLAIQGVLGLDVALPIGHEMVVEDIVEAYGWLGQVWVETLRDLSVPARLVSIEEARATKPAGPFARHLRRACFGSLSPYEVVVGARKLVGLAQVRRRNAILLQSGLHLRFDADHLASLIAPEQARDLARALRQAAMGLEEVAPDRSAQDVRDAFEKVMKRMLEIDLVPGAWTPQELSHAGIDSVPETADDVVPTGRP